MGQAFPAAGHPGSEERTGPDLPADRPDEQPRPPRAQGLGVELGQLGAPIVVDHDHDQPSFISLREGDPHPLEQRTERLRIHTQ